MTPETREWAKLLGGGSMIIETQRGVAVALCSGRDDYEDRVKRGEVALSPKELDTVLASGGGPSFLDAVALIKSLDPAAKVTPESEGPAGPPPRSKRRRGASSVRRGREAEKSKRVSRRAKTVSVDQLPIPSALRGRQD
jgi:hypothetical protein